MQTLDHFWPAKMRTQQRAKAKQEATKTIKTLYVLVKHNKNAEKHKGEEENVQIPKPPASEESSPSRSHSFARTHARTNEAKAKSEKRMRNAISRFGGSDKPD